MRYAGILPLAVILRTAATKNLQSLPRRGPGGGEIQRGGSSQFNSRRLNTYKEKTSLEPTSKLTMMVNGDYKPTPTITNEVQ